MKKEPPRPMIGDMLAEKAFMATIPRRIAVRMNAVRHMSNLGPHGEEVNATDAIRVMRDLIDILEWYVVHLDPSCHVAGDPGGAMSFRAVRLGHGERAPWSKITHVKLREGVVADTDQGQRVLDHINAHADSQGVAAITRIAPGFPARENHLDSPAAMRVDLRHMANRREAGYSEQNKGLLELGWIE